MKNILITGRPGIGKTTIIEKVLSGLQGIKMQGFFTREIREGGERTGFKIITLGGKEGLLAHININSTYQVSKYKVNIRDIERLIIPALIPDKTSHLIVFDEVGRMELFVPQLKTALLQALDSEKPVFGTIQLKAEPFVNMVKKRDDVKLSQVSTHNRDKLPNELLSILKKLLSK
jgi:nucleoside-triphosphatase